MNHLLGLALGLVLCVHILQIKASIALAGDTNLIFKPHPCPCLGPLPFGKNAGDKKTNYPETTVDLDVQVNFRGEMFNSLQIMESGGFQTLDENDDVFMRQLVYQDPSLSEGCDVFFRTTTDMTLLDDLSTLVQCQNRRNNFCATYALVITWVDISENCKHRFKGTPRTKGNTFQAVIVTDGQNTYVLMNYIHLKTEGLIVNRYGLSPFIQTFHHPLSEKPDLVLNDDQCCPGLYLFDIGFAAFTVEEAFGNTAIFPAPDGCDPGRCRLGCLTGNTVIHNGVEETLSPTEFKRFRNNNQNIRCVKRIQKLCGKHDWALIHNTAGLRSDCKGKYDAFVQGYCDEVKCYEGKFNECYECSLPICRPFKNSCTTGDQGSGGSSGFGAFFADDDSLPPSTPEVAGTEPNQPEAEG